MRSFNCISKADWNRANDDAIRILHRAWIEVSGMQGVRVDAASKFLAHAKLYLLRQTWGDVS